MHKRQAQSGVQYGEEVVRVFREASETVVFGEVRYREGIRRRRNRRTDTQARHGEVTRKREEAPIGGSSRYPPDRNLIGIGRIETARDEATIVALCEYPNTVMVSPASNESWIAPSRMVFP